MVAARAVSLQASHPFSCILCRSSMNTSLRTCARKHAAGVIDTPLHTCTDRQMVAAFPKTVVTFLVTTLEYFRRDVGTFSTMFVATKLGISCHKHDLYLTLSLCLLHLNLTRPLSVNKCEDATLRNVKL